jgi:hypothetical protein
MARARDFTNWNHTSAIVATILNVNRGEDDSPVESTSIHPYVNSDHDDSETKIKLTPETLHLLKNMPGVRS